MGRGGMIIPRKVISTAVTNNQMWEKYNKFSQESPYSLVSLGHQVICGLVGLVSEDTYKKNHFCSQKIGLFPLTLNDCNLSNCDTSFSAQSSFLYGIFQIVLLSCPPVSSSSLHCPSTSSIPLPSLLCFPLNFLSPSSPSLPRAKLTIFLLQGSPFSGYSLVNLFHS